MKVFFTRSQLAPPLKMSLAMELTFSWIPGPSGLSSSVGGACCSCVLVELVLEAGVLDAGAPGVVASGDVDGDAAVVVGLVAEVDVAPLDVADDVLVEGGGVKVVVVSVGGVKVVEVSVVEVLVVSLGEVKVLDVLDGWVVVVVGSVVVVVVVGSVVVVVSLGNVKVLVALASVVACFASLGDAHASALGRAAPAAAVAAGASAAPAASAITAAGSPHEVRRRSVIGYSPVVGDGQTATDRSAWAVEPTKDPARSYQYPTPRQPHASHVYRRSACRRLCACRGLASSGACRRRVGQKQDDFGSTEAGH